MAGAQQLCRDNDRFNCVNPFYCVSRGHFDAYFFTVVTLLVVTIVDSTNFDGLVFIVTGQGGERLNAFRSRLESN